MATAVAGLAAALQASVNDVTTRQRIQAARTQAQESLFCYDTLRRHPAGLGDTTFLTFGSQVGNPFVRDCFAGRFESLKVRRWSHLFNPDDHVLTAPVRINAPNFAQVEAKFDTPGDVLNHDPICYFNHANTQGRVWLDVAGGAPSRSVTRGFETLHTAAKRPRRRALLVR